MSWPPTIFDDDDKFAEYRVHPESPDLETATVIAPCCGRECAADMVTDLRAVPGTVIRPGGNSSPLQDVEFACDGCYRRVIAEDTNPWTDSKLARALGAPKRAIARKRARETMREKMRRDGTVKPKAFLEQQVAELRQQDPVPGTDPPDVS